MIAVWNVVRLFLLALLGSWVLLASDEQRLALAMQAQTELDRVELAAVPRLRDSAACVQSQAGLLPIAEREDLPVIHYHKGYCQLAGALITHNAGEFSDAAAEFDKAIETWPGLAAINPKNRPPELVPAGLRVLASVARLEAGFDQPALDRAWKDISAAVASPACSSNWIPPKFCSALVDTGREWLGWIALRRESADEAARYFYGLTGTGWPEWVAGRKAFADRQYREAAAQYRQAIDDWTRARQEPAPSMAARLGPPPNTGAALADLGGAQLLAGDSTVAIATLDAAIKADPSDARAFFLRARGKELVGQTELALADYSLASRTAFANAKDLASGEAHLYRGIAFYRRKDFARAETEFSSALNFEIRSGLRPDAEAWRHLAAVAGGACVTSREYLERSLATVSPYFPKEEARSVAAACVVSGTTAPFSGPAGGGL